MQHLALQVGNTKHSPPAILRSSKTRVYGINVTYRLGNGATWGSASPGLCEAHQGNLAIKFQTHDATTCLAHHGITRAPSDSARTECAALHCGINHVTAPLVVLFLNFCPVRPNSICPTLPTAHQD